jgi:hypothetical protein
VGWGGEEWGGEENAGMGRGWGDVGESGEGLLLESVEINSVFSLLLNYQLLHSLK